MPISPIVLQRRHAELGRIRLGDKGDRGQPQKLHRFRFTSPSETYIKDIATLYGGTPQPWDNNGKAEFEVYTDAATIPVIAVKGGLSQWMEYWQGGGIVHRCDGETNVLTSAPCDHEEKVKTRVRGQDVWVNPHAEAKPTTRLSVMLPELDAIGVWRMESKGWNAAAEIPAVAELAQYVGDLVPAVLHLVERRTVKDGQTSRFVVPVLDLRIGASRLREIAAEKAGLVLPAGSGPKALEAPAGADPFVEFFDELPGATSLNDLEFLWKQMVDAQLVGPKSPETARREEFVAAFKVRAGELKGEPAAAEPKPDADGVVDAELVPDDGEAGGSNADLPNADAVWAEIVKVGGALGYMLPDLEDDFARQMGGLTSNEASAEELRVYLDKLNAAVPA